MSDPHFLFKLIICGPVASGKSNILRRYTNDNFTSEHSLTIGVEFASKTITYNGAIVKLQIWDTAGHEKFRAITRSYYRGSHGVLLVFDCTNEESFRGLNVFQTQIAENISDVPVYLIANKIDLVNARAVSATTAYDYATSHGMIYAEVSAKTNVGLDSVFTSLVDRIQQPLLVSQDVHRSADTTTPTNPIGRLDVTIAKIHGIFTNGMQNSAYSKKPTKVKINLGLGEMEESAYSKCGNLIVSYERDDYLYTQGLPSAKTGITISFLISDSHYDIAPFETFFNDLFNLPDLVKSFQITGINVPKISVKFDYSQKEGKKVVLLTIDLSDNDTLNNILNNVTSILTDNFELPKLLEIVNLNFSNSFKSQTNQSGYSYNSSSSTDEELKITGKINFEMCRGVLEFLLTLCNPSEGNKPFLAVLSAMTFGFKGLSFDLEFDDLTKLFQEILGPYFFGAESSTTKFTLSNLQEKLTPGFVNLFFPDPYVARSTSKEDLENAIPDLYKTFFNLFLKDNFTPEISELKFFIGNKTVLKLGVSGLALLSIIPSPSALVAELHKDI